MTVTTLDPTIALIVIDLQKGIVPRPMSPAMDRVVRHAAALTEALHEVADVAASEVCASRALLRIEAAVSAPTEVSVRSTSVASDLTWLAASDDALTSVFCASRAQDVIVSAEDVPAIDSERCKSAANDMT